MEAGESNASSECSHLGWLLMLAECLIVETHGGGGGGGGGGWNLVGTVLTGILLISLQSTRPQRNLDQSVNSAKAEKSCHWAHSHPKGAADSRET